MGMSSEESFLNIARDGPRGMGGEGCGEGGREGEGKGEGKWEVPK